MEKIGYVICIIGRRHSGKTPIARRLAENSGFKNLVVYDRRREYDPEKYTLFYSIEKFKQFFTQLQNSFIICEEATGFINAFKELEFTDILIGAEHNRNIICFLFHSLSDAPDYILRLSNYVILLATNDEPEKVRINRPKFYPFLEEARKGKDIYIDINNL